MTLLPIGASPHDYQASAQQAAALQSADLVVANGLALEEGLIDLLASAEADGANILTLAPLLDPIPFSGGVPEDDHDDDHGGDDPHVWLDPIRMAEAGRLIAAQLRAIDPSVDWEARAQAYAGELETADDQIRAILDEVQASDRKLVTNHGSFGYFALRYDFDVIGIVIPGGSTLADPSSAALTDLVDEIVAQGVPAIFGETTESTALAEAIADESGATVQVVQLYTGSLGEAGSGAETLIDLLVTNAERIAAALS
jgi:zinc/manganese transport system substrate-binding protein